jgi:ABC-2 type transport system permease protein
VNGFCAVYRREMAAYFQSPVFYVVAFVFLGIFGYLYYTAVGSYAILSFQAQNPMLAGRLNATDMVLTPLLHDMSVVMLLVMPLLTMRLFSEERRSGTIELLFTYPLRDAGTLFAKVAAAFSVFALILAATLPCILYLASITKLDPGVVIASYLGLLLLVAAFQSLGVFASSLTENQIVAAIGSFGALLIFWLLGFVQEMTGDRGLVAYFSIVGHFNAFTRGVVDTRDVAFYLIFSAFFLFGTLRVLETTRWRG